MFTFVVAVIDLNDPRDLKITVQSTVDIPGMTDIYCNAYPDAQITGSPFGDIKSNYSASPLSGSNAVTPPMGAVGRRMSAHQSTTKSHNPFGPPVVAISTWEVLIGFESARNCELVAQHIMTSRYCFVDQFNLVQFIAIYVESACVRQDWTTLGLS